MCRFPAALLLAVLFGHFVAAATSTRPNVVFILVDDLGWTDLGCQGSKYYFTPHIDRLAELGLRFTSAYTCGPNCQPTRAALMSGQYGPRTGVYTVGNIERFAWRTRSLRPVENVEQLPLDRKTVGDVMKSAGYATGLFGKWHLGDMGNYHPSHRGFDISLVSMGKHFHFEMQPHVAYPKDTYLADFLTNKAIEFIKQNQKQPFFLYLPHFGVHSPLEAKSNWIEWHRGRPASGGHHDPVYAAMISSVDESVGHIMATLDDLQLTENTIVIFTSDNGGVGGYAREGLTQTDDVTDNAPLRSGKGSLYEGGVRVPWIVHWPGHIPVGVTDTPIISVDLLPTMAALAGATLPTNQPLDGVSLVDCFVNGGRLAQERDLFWHFPGYLGAGKRAWRTTPASAIRSGNWKLIEFLETGNLELYNVVTDLSQKRNVADQQPTIARDLHTRLTAWRKTIDAPMPTPNPERKP